MPLRFSPNRGVTAVALVSRQAVSFIETATEWTVVDSAAHTVTENDRRLWVTVNPCTITFPLSSNLTFDVIVKDAAGGAAANNIHTAYSGGETCDGLSDIPITSNYGWVIIGPKPVGSGYTQIG